MHSEAETSIPLPHNAYLKQFVLNGPVVRAGGSTQPYDVILLDEAQDVNLVGAASLAHIMVHSMLGLPDPRDCLDFRAPGIARIFLTPGTARISGLGVVGPTAYSPTRNPMACIRFSAAPARSARLLLCAWGVRATRSCSRPPGSACMHA